MFAGVSLFHFAKMTDVQIEFISDKSGKVESINWSVGDTEGHIGKRK